LWSEINVEEATWTVPAGRMKGSREHRVPLSDRAVEFLHDVPRENGDEHVFLGAQRGGGLSNMALAAVLKRMGRDQITVHGFRSTFRDWAAESTNHPREVAEQTLAHTLPDKVESAYRRGDLFEKRRRLMEDWAQFCARQAIPSDVVPIRRREPAGAA
jgi:integrase